VKKPFFVIALLFVMTFMLSACGGGGGGPSTTIDVTMAEFTFLPSSFTVPAGQEITVNAKNNGAVVHNFVIMKLGQTVGDSFGPEDEGNVYWEIEALPGVSVSGTFTAPTEPGEYQVVCRTEGHFMAGMVGKLTVVAAQ
jgi:uncharacterized cupredoxin-like copper-binding protein